MIFVSAEFESNGWPGYLAYFGLLTLPVLLIVQHGRRFEDSLIMPGLMLVMSAIFIDLLPNAGLVPYVWMLAGVVLKDTAEVDAAPVPSLSSGRRTPQQDGVEASILPRRPALRPSCAAFPRRHGGS